MGFLFILPIAAACVWIIVTTLRRIFRERTGSTRLRILAMLLFIGTALGIWLAFFLEYKPNAYYRFCGFPIPLVVFHLEDGQWIDFIMPLPIQIGGAIANLLFGLAVPCLPLKISKLLDQFRPDEKTTGG